METDATEDSTFLKDSTYKYYCSAVAWTLQSQLTTIYNSVGSSK